MDKQIVSKLRNQLDLSRTTAYHKAKALSYEINKHINEDTSIVFGDKIYQLIETKVSKLCVDIIFVYKNEVGTVCRRQLHPSHSFEVDNNIIYTGKRPK